MTSRGGSLLFSRTFLPLRYSTIPPISTTITSCLQPQSQFRQLHKTVPAAPVPPPTPFVPDVPTLLKLIGRNMKKYATKLPAWDDFFRLSSPEMRDMGIETAQDRRYILRWREKFRKGEYGVGGDLLNVEDGVAELRAVQAPIEKRTDEKMKKNNASAAAATATTGSLITAPGHKWVIVNPPRGQPVSLTTTTTIPKFAEIRLHDGNQIKGPYIKFVKGAHATVAELRAEEGMWEHKLGRKIDGGERRRAQVRVKMRAQERRMKATTA